ncbi:DUF6427 family protein [Tenacibaculum sp. SZ-18]|uniref:DUF6427 family protein n=1 Tax=Tenacibaculum sp. SZ-18 TaxID=754423 RepID=UPI0012FE02C8|nr:DUF6427 family protein [Tenacibaculum sp. SZ-18]
MLTNFFSNTKPFTSFVLISLFFCYAISAFFSDLISEFNISLGFWFLVLFGLANFINSRNNLTFDNSYFFLIFIILIGHVPSVIRIDSFFFSNLVLLIYVRRVYSLQSSKNIIKKLFDSGFWMGVSFLIEPFTIVLFPLTLLSSILHQHLDYRKLITPIFGIITPIILFYTYHFWYDSPQEFYTLFNFLTYYDFSIYNAFIYKYFLGTVFLLIFISFVLKTPKTLSINNTFRKNWILVCFHLFLTIVLMLILKERTGSEIAYLLFPCAIVIANGFELIRKKWYSDIILILLFLSSLLHYFM